MMKSFLYFFIIISTFISCTSEKVTVSPMTGILSSEPAVVNRNFQDQTDAVFYSSELTNAMSTFPKLQNTAVNEEVARLKKGVRNYVYALQQYNIDARKDALDEVEKSYKKIQTLRKFLNKDDDDVINRYLVRIKSNITKLEALNKQNNSISVQQ